MAVGISAVKSRRLRGGEFIEATWPAAGTSRGPPRLAASAAASSSRPQGCTRLPPVAPGVRRGLAASAAASSSRRVHAGDGRPGLQSRRLRGGEFIEARYLLTSRMPSYGCLAASAAASSSRHDPLDESDGRGALVSPPPRRRVHRGGSTGRRPRSRSAKSRRLRGGEFIEADQRAPLGPETGRLAASAAASSSRPAEPRHSTRHSTRRRGGLAASAAASSSRPARRCPCRPDARRRLAASAAASSSRRGVNVTPDEESRAGLAASAAASSSRPRQGRLLRRAPSVSPPPRRRVHRGERQSATSRGPGCLAASAAASSSRLQLDLVQAVLHPGLAASAAASSSRQVGRPAAGRERSESRRLRGGEFIEAVRRVGSRPVAVVSPPAAASSSRHVVEELRVVRMPESRRLRGGEFIEAPIPHRERARLRPVSPPPRRRVHRGRSHRGDPHLGRADSPAARSRRLRGGEFIEADRLGALSATDAGGSRRLRGGEFIEAGRPTPPARTGCGSLAASTAASSSRPVSALRDAFVTHVGLAASTAASSSRHRPRRPRSGRARAVSPPPRRRVHRGPNCS